MLILERRILRKIFDGLLALFLENQRGELRTDAVKIVRMLISMIWDDFGEFFREVIKQEKRPRVAAGNAAALIRAVHVVNQVPPWLRDLLDFLKTAHKDIRAYRIVIDKATAEFWKRMGSREFPEIDDLRITFSGGYFA
jgi:hypothetical protein